MSFKVVIIIFIPSILWIRTNIHFCKPCSIIIISKENIFIIKNKTRNKHYHAKKGL